MRALYTASLFLCACSTGGAPPPTSAIESSELDAPPRGAQIVFPEAPALVPPILPELELPKLESLPGPRGALLHVVELDRSATVEVLLVVKGGADAPGLLAGQAELSVRAAVSDALSKDPELARILSTGGASFSGRVMHDRVELHLSGLPADLEKLLAIAAAGASAGAVTAESLERIRSGLMDRVFERGRNSQELAWSLLFEEGLGTKHPSAWAIEGTPTTLGRVTPKRAHEIAEQLLCADRAALFVVGRTVAVDAAIKAKKAFGAWRRCAPTPASSAFASVAARSRVIIVDTPGRGQVRLMAAVALASADPEALELFAEAIAGSGASRLNRTLRTRGAFTYGAHAFVRDDLAIGTLAIQTDLDQTQWQLALSGLLGAVDGLGKEPLSASELERARRRLLYRKKQEWSEPFALIRELARRYSRGRPLAGPALRIDDANVNAAAATLKSEQLQLVLIGDAQKLVPALPALGLGAAHVIRPGRVR